MPKFDSKVENQSWELLRGDYPFEIVAVDSEISKGAKTRGSDTREVKLKFFSDKTFATPKGQWTETLIYHESTEWKCSLFAKCVGYPLKDGEDFDIDGSWVGRRGWATCKPDPDSQNATKPTAEHRFYNRVQMFITNKEMLPPNPETRKPIGDDVEIGPDGNPLPF